MPTITNSELRGALTHPVFKGYVSSIFLNLCFSLGYVLTMFGHVLDMLEKVMYLLCLGKVFASLLCAPPQPFPL